MKTTGLAAHAQGAQMVKLSLFALFVMSMVTLTAAASALPV